MRRQSIRSESKNVIERVMVYKVALIESYESCMV
jgi:hypothetical protein